MKGLLVDMLCPSKLFTFCGRRLVGRLSSFTHLSLQAEHRHLLSGLSLQTTCKKMLTTETSDALGEGKSSHYTEPDSRINIPNQQARKERSFPG